jgi:nitrate reductase beta subunit
MFDMEDTAVLSSFKNYTTFSFGGKTLTFRTCAGLERYVKVLTWDKGYIEVMAKYRQREHEIEEYIDLEPVLNDLYMNKDAFLAPIKNVRIEYAQ